MEIKIEEKTHTEMSSLYFVIIIREEKSINKPHEEAWYRRFCPIRALCTRIHIVCDIATR